MSICETQSYLDVPYTHTVVIWDNHMAQFASGFQAQGFLRVPLEHVAKEDMEIFSRVRNTLDRLGRF